MNPEVTTNETLLPIRVVGEVATIESLLVADGLGIKHKNLLETIRTHKAEIESNFGPIAFEARKTTDGDSTFETSNLSKGKRSTKPITVAHLTEDQVLFIGTLSRNSEQVVKFKAVLVKSFAESRKREQANQSTLPPVVPTTEQVLIQLVSQQNQLMAGTQELLSQLRSDVDSIMAGNHLPPPPPTPRRNVGRQLGLPGIPAPIAPQPSLRQQINRKIDEYCEYQGYDRHETFRYLYRRMFEVYAVNVNRLNRAEGESIIDAIERYGRLNDLYKLITNELH